MILTLVFNNDGTTALAVENDGTTSFAEAQALLAAVQTFLNQAAAPLTLTGEVERHTHEREQAFLPVQHTH